MHNLFLRRSINLIILIVDFNFSLSFTLFVVFVRFSTFSASDLHDRCADSVGGIRDCSAIRKQFTGRTRSFVNTFIKQLENTRRWVNAR